MLFYLTTPLSHSIQSWDIYTTKFWSPTYRLTIFKEKCRIWKGNSHNVSFINWEDHVYPVDVVESSLTATESVRTVIGSVSVEAIGVYHRRCCRRCGQRATHGAIDGYWRHQTWPTTAYSSFPFPFSCHCEAMRPYTYCINFIHRFVHFLLDVLLAVARMRFVICTSWTFRRRSRLIGPAVIDRPAPDQRHFEYHKFNASQ